MLPFCTLLMGTSTGVITRLRWINLLHCIVQSLHSHGLSTTSRTALPELAEAQSLRLRSRRPRHTANTSLGSTDGITNCNLQLNKGSSEIDAHATHFTARTPNPVAARAGCEAARPCHTWKPI